MRTVPAASLYRAVQQLQQALRDLLRDPACVRIDAKAVVAYHRQIGVVHVALGELITEATKKR